MSLLTVRDLRTGYGALPVLQGISFSIEEGSATVLLGLNGAGKTTTVNTLAGLLRPWSGEILLEGTSVGGRSPEQMVALGVSLCPEGRRVFAELSVRDNLELGAWSRRRRGGGGADPREAVFRYFPRLAERSGQLAGTLSGGEQQMLAVGRSLMASPRLLLVDEASLGLSPRLAQTVFEVMRAIADDGVTVLIVEQNVGMLPLANHALVMEKGTLTYDGTAAELERTQDLRSVYLG